jgi:two-component system CheB/CheR fusion protein
MAAKNIKSQASLEKKEKKKSSALKRKRKPPAKLSLKETPTVKTPAKGFPIIGVGSSTGGLEALEKFFKNMPSDSGAAFILISHLSPD